MKLQRGDVILLRLEFHQAPGGKVRPGVVILDTNDDDLVVAPVTSRPQFSTYDFPIQDWRHAGLNVVHKLAVQPKSQIARCLGRLTDSDRDALAMILARAFHG